MFIIHGPVGHATGLGYTAEYLGHNIEKLGIAVETQADGSEGWRTPGYHLIINQPAVLPEAVPWHGFVPFFEFTPRADEIPKLQLNWPKRTIFCSNPWMKEEVVGLQLSEDLKKRVFDFQLGANVGRISLKSRVPGSVVTVGKAEPRKGTNILLDALDKAGVAATLAITHPLHTEHDQRDISDQLRSHRMEHTLVPFFQSHDEVRALLDVSHVAVFPACAEGWNMGLTEALASGCIVVASDIPAHNYQYRLLADDLGTDRADQHLILVPTYEQPMEYHSRWYPMSHYAGQKWMAPNANDVAGAIERALCLPEPPAFDEGSFPLSWRNAAYKFVQRVLVDRCERRPDKTPEDIGASLGIRGELTSEMCNAKMA